MHNERSQKPGDPRQSPWNKGKLIGSKPPLRTKDVWSMRLLDAGEDAFVLGDR